MWHPIERGPKTGREVLLWNKSLGRFVGYWNSQYKEWRTSLMGYTVEPTHWTEIPDPPEEKDTVL